MNKMMKNEKKYVRAIIDNVNFDSTLEEIFLNRKKWSPAEIIVYNSHYYMEELKKEGKTEFCCHWTVRPWMKEGDVVFFMCAKSSVAKVRRLQKQFDKELSSLEQKYSEDVIKEMKDYLYYGEKTCEVFAGTIFAIGIVSGNPYYEAPENTNPHWKTRTYAQIENIYLLKDNPIPYENIKDFITLSIQTAITPVYGDEFGRLFGMVKESVELPAIYDNLVAAPKDLVQNEKQDWLSQAKKYGFRFTQEAEFRSIFVNSFLGTLATDLRIYRECECIKKGVKHPSYVDNVIYMDEKLLPIEVKLNIHAEKNLKGQVRKYCHLSELYLDSTGARVNMAKMTYRDNVLIIDAEGLYMFDYQDDSITKLCKLSSLKSLKAIPTLRKIIKGRIK